MTNGRTRSVRVVERGTGTSANYWSAPTVITTHGSASTARSGSGVGALLDVGAWDANDAVLTPFRPHETMTIVKMAIIVEIQDGNVDVGIYDSSFSRLASAGSTAAGAAGIQVFDIADTTLTAGELYYAAFVTDSETLRTHYASFASTLAGRSAGTVMDTNSFPLPATVTPTINNEQQIPLIAMSTLTTYG